jgi:glycosyltransferase involved in cell wall biosynthesis
VSRVLARLGRPDVAIFHAFRRSPYGGSNQFLLALREELRMRGLRVRANAISSRTRACVVNAHVFDEAELRRALHPGCRFIHRIDGPLASYRGFDDGTDRYLSRVNLDLADATVFQSRYSLEASAARGLEFRDPVVIPNAVDPAIFHPPDRREPLEGRRLRLISTSWSDNPNKGAAALALLDRQLDRSRFELTFVGRTAIDFKGARMVPPAPSQEVARLLREHDVFISPSRNDPCSNALLEALACGLPAVYLDSGGHRELVGDAGVAYEDDRELPDAVERIAGEVADRRARIVIPSLKRVADRYLAAMGMEAPSP